MYFSSVVNAKIVFFLNTQFNTMGLCVDKIVCFDRSEGCFLAGNVLSLSFANFKKISIFAYSSV